MKKRRSLKPIRISFNPKPEVLKQYLAMYYVGTPKDIFNLPSPSSPLYNTFQQDRAKVPNAIDALGRKWASYWIHLDRVSKLILNFFPYYRTDEPLTRPLIDQFLFFVKKQYPKIYEQIKDWHTEDFQFSYEHYVDFERLAHYTSLPYPEIAAYQPDMKKSWIMTSGQLFTIEEAYKKKGKAVTFYKKSQLDWGRTIVKFNDDYFWERLLKSHSSKEATALDLCGRSGRNWDLISFRKYHPMVDKYTVHLLAEYSEAYGFINELKGFQNQKPDEKFHKYIVGLLLHDSVTYYVGKGYEAEDNFQPEDLSKELYDALIAKKPYIFNFKKWLETHPTEMSELANEILSEELTPIFEYGDKKPYFYSLVEGVSIYDILEKQKQKHPFDRDFYDIFHYDNPITKDSIEDALSSLSRSNPPRFKRLVVHLTKKYKNKFYFSDIAEIASFIYDNTDGDEKLFFSDAWESASMKKFIKNWTENLIENLEDKTAFTIIKVKNGEYHYGITADTLRDMLIEWNDTGEITEYDFGLKDIVEETNAHTQYNEPSYSEFIVALGEAIDANIN